LHNQKAGKQDRTGLFLTGKIRLFYLTLFLNAISGFYILTRRNIKN